MKYNKYIILFLFLFVFLITWYGVFHKYREGMESSSKNIELVIARYNEDLKWLKEEPFNKYRAIVYNKGVNDDFHKTNSNKIIKLENVGRCDHTYLYHIIENYDNLADVTIFLPGSADMPHKMNNIKKLMSSMESNKTTTFIGNKMNNVRNDLSDFKMDNYASTNSNNNNLNNENKTQLATIRPYGKWYDSFFKDIIIHYVSYYGIFAVSREHIRQHPKSYYEKLIKELNTSSNPEAGHYFERSWNAVFHPLDGAVFIDP